MSKFDRHIGGGRTAESREPREGIKEKIIACLREHIVDIKPTPSERGVLGTHLVAAEKSSVHRCDPALQIPKLVLERGKIAVLVGPNGAGKSTLLDAIMSRRNSSFDEGMHAYNKGVHGKEALRVSRLDQEELLQDINDISVKDVLEHVQEFFVEQFPVDWEDWEHIEPETNEANEAAQVRIKTIMSQAVQLFEVNHFLDRNVGELSGGERTKLSLLMMLASEPDVLLLDEPTNHLDLESIAKLTGLFDSYKRAGVSIVNVSHVEWFLDMVGEGTIELTRTKDKREVTQSNSRYADFKKRAAEKSTIQRDITWDRVGSKARIGAMFEFATSTTIPDSPIQNSAIPFISGRDITVLSGKNGTGKTKFMEQLANPSSKNVKRAEKAQTAYMPQLWPEAVMNGSVGEFFQWVKEHSNPHSDVAPSRFQKELNDLGFASMRHDVLKQPFSKFSGGEQRLLWFAAASVIEGTDALILDEPTNHMDEATMMSIVEAIRRFPGAVVLSTHDLRLMEALQKDSGPSRQGIGITNIEFSRKADASVHIAQKRKSPLEDAKETIATAKQQAKRVKV